MAFFGEMAGRQAACLGVVGSDQAVQWGGRRTPGFHYRDFQRRHGGAQWRVVERPDRQRRGRRQLGQPWQQGGIAPGAGGQIVAGRRQSFGACLYGAGRRRVIEPGGEQGDGVGRRQGGHREGGVDSSGVTITRGGPASDHSSGFGRKG